MSEKKTIIFNNSIVTNKTKKNNGVKKEKPKAIIKPNTLKKTLLQKIKTHQQKEKISKDNTEITGLTENVENANNVNKDMEFHNNFIDSLEYLNKVSEKHKHKKKEKKKNKTLKNETVGGNRPPSKISFNPVLVEVDLPTDFDGIGGGGKPKPPLQQPKPPLQQPPLYLSQMRSSPPTSFDPPTSSNKPTLNKSPIMERGGPNNYNIKNDISLPDKPYGCLKGGSKPTFRQYHNKTFKKKSILPNNKKPILERQNTLNDLKKSYKKIKQTKRKTKKSIYNLGRTGRKISVLIKNNSTRRKIKREYGLLKQKSLNDIKKHLYEKNLIKIGSTAPNDVLRTIYEQSILAGDVTNTSGDIQIHNFVNK